jgi:quercetin dioxygenase-like cupin family protein
MSKSPDDVIKLAEEMHEKVPFQETVKRKYHKSDGLVSIEMHIPQGVWIGKHRHSYSHLSFLSQGVVELQVGGVKSIIQAPACVEIKAGFDHTVLAVTDTVWYCTHATDYYDL